MERITGHHIVELKEHYDMLQLQPLLGMYLAKINTHMSKPDTPLDDATRCLIIRLLNEAPDLLPHFKMRSYADLLDTVVPLKADKRFPLPTNKSSLGVLIGRGFSTNSGLGKALKADAEQPARKLASVLGVWITLLLQNLDGLLEHGKEHLIYQVMEEEATARGLSLQEITYNRGWPSTINDPENPSLMTGRDITRLEECGFDMYDLQQLLGLYINKISTLKNPVNADLPIEDIARCLVMRLLLKDPSQSPLPALIGYNEFSAALSALADGDLPEPLTNMPSQHGVLIGRSLSTVTSLRSAADARKEMRVLKVWMTTLVNELPALVQERENHPIYRVIVDEAASRDLTLREVAFNRGWPSAQSAALTA